MLKSDKWIREKCEKEDMLKPFFDKSVKYLNGEKVPSFGLTSYGYDIRLGPTIKAFRSTEIQDYFINGKCIPVAPVTHGGNVTNPLTLDSDQSKYYQVFEDIERIVLPVNGFILGNTMEYFRMPAKVTGVCMGKSTLARMGCSVLVTPIECHWSGYLTLEIKNLNTVPIELIVGAGIAQIQFFESDEDCEVSYKDRGGKYMDQPNYPVDARL